MKKNISGILFSTICILGTVAFAEEQNKIIAKCSIPDKAPQLISQTCYSKLIQDGGSLQPQPSYANFFEFEPQFPAYSDGASKRRWIYLPEDTKIKTEDLDNWVFPKGSVIFKDFYIREKKIETRIMEKTKEEAAPNSWRYTNYAWLTDQKEAKLITEAFVSLPEEEMKKFSAGEVSAQFKVSTPRACIRCHSGASDAVNGFNYMQLSGTGRFDIFTATRAGIFSSPPKERDLIPGLPLDQKAIGYIQSNCAICHSPIGSGQGDFRHSYKAKSLSEERLMVTAEEAGLISRGHPEKSYLLERFESGDMPKVKPVNKDATGIDLIREWISSLK